MIDKAYLESVGITDAETIDKITATYSADIKAEQDAAAAVQTQLDEASKTIQSYKDMDIDGIKASVEDYKQQLAKSEADRKAFEYKSKLQAYVKSQHLRDDVYEAYVTNLLESKGLQFDGDKLIGGDDVIKAFRETHAGAFAPDKGEQTATPTSGGVPEGLSAVEKRFYEKNPDLKPE